MIIILFRVYKRQLIVGSVSTFSLNRKLRKKEEKKIGCCHCLTRKIRLVYKKIFYDNPIGASIKLNQKALGEKNILKIRPAIFICK